MTTQHITFINSPYGACDTQHSNCFHQSIIDLGYHVEYTNHGQAQHDIHIYSNQGCQHDHVDSLRIFYTGESLVPDWKECDYAIGFMKENILYPDCYYRFPWWLITHSGIKRHGAAGNTNRDFCSFVVSDIPYWQSNYRIKMFDILQSYKTVQSAGAVRNNIGSIGRSIQDKLDFLSHFKFNLCFENYSCPGYSTEKLFDAIAANTLPIYWGDPRLPEDINPRRYINAHDFANLSALMEYIKKVDQDDAFYQSYFEEPLFLDNQRKPEDYIEGLKAFLAPILSHRRRRIHERISHHGNLLIPSYTHLDL